MSWWRHASHNLTKLRNSHGFSKSRLSRLTGIDRRVIQLLEKGERPITMTHAIKFRDVYGVSIDSLIKEPG